MNANQATTLSSNQDLNELTVSIKPIWHRPSLTHTEIKRTLGGSGVGCDGATPTSAC